MKYQYVNFIGDIIEVFNKENPHLLQLKEDKIKKIIKKGESENVEFKSTLRINIYTEKPDHKIEHAILKTITAFLNSKGGILFIGIGDKGEILGLENDRFPSNDKFYLHFTNLINKKLGPEKKSLINTDFVEISGKTIFIVDVIRSEKPVFLTYEQREYFYIRIGPSTIELAGSKLIAYINEHFT